MPSRFASARHRPDQSNARYSIYFYGKLATTPNWGIFRSTDAGTSWRRVAYYPTGIFDQPTCMAASWDDFAKVMVGFNGNSFVAGTNDADTPARSKGD